LLIFAFIKGASLGLSLHTFSCWEVRGATARSCSKMRVEAALLGRVRISKREFSKVNSSLLFLLLWTSDIELDLPECLDHRCWHYVAGGLRRDLAWRSEPSALFFLIRIFCDWLLWRHSSVDNLLSFNRGGVLVAHHYVYNIILHNYRAWVLFKTLRLLWLRINVRTHGASIAQARRRPRWLDFFHDSTVALGWVLLWFDGVHIKGWFEQLRHCLLLIIVGCLGPLCCFNNWGFGGYFALAIVWNEAHSLILLLPSSSGSICSLKLPGRVTIR